MAPAVPSGVVTCAVSSWRPRSGASTGAKLQAVPEPPAPTDWRLLTEQLLERCEGLCEGCGLPLPALWVEWDRHHRKLRSQGGGDVLWNLVALHSRCHVIAPEAVHERVEWATGQGLIVKSSSDPLAAVLWLPDRRGVLLGPEPRYEVVWETPDG